MNHLFLKNHDLVPDEPDEPSVPEEPDVPEEPLEPSVPEEPLEPEVPAAPSFVPTTPEFIS